MKNNITVLVIAFFLTGCARFSTVQTDYSYDKGQVTRATRTHASSWTFYDSKSKLANFKANQTDKSQLTTVGSLDQEASGTNSVALIHALAGLVSVMPK